MFKALNKQQKTNITTSCAVREHGRAGSTYVYLQLLDM